VKDICCCLSIVSFTYAGTGHGSTRSLGPCRLLVGCPVRLTLQVLCDHGERSDLSDLGSHDWLAVLV